MLDAECIMWFRRKKESEPIRKKREPKEWEIPQDSAAEIIGLYDDMIRAALAPRRCTRKLPRFLFWQKVVEIIPGIRGYPVQVEDTSDRFCIKIVEIVADDDYEPEQQTVVRAAAETVLRELEDKLDQCRPSLSPTIEESLDRIETKPDLGRRKS
jgi:hypothetical protein